LALALEGPATEVLRDLDTSHPQAYNIIWDALARRFGSLDGAREAMRRFDSRRQEDNETIPDFEQALRSLHREAWPTAIPEQRDAALKRRFEDGLLSSDMVQFLRLHARDLDFQATVIKARQFADATSQSKPKKRVNFIDNRPRSPAQPEWEPLLQGFRDMMTEALQPLQRALRSQGQGNAPSSSTAPAPPQPRPATPQLNPPPRGAWQNRQPRQGCFVCGAFGCHTVIHERNGTLPPNFRRASISGSNDRSGNNSNNNSRLNANARVFIPSPNGQRRSPTGNSGGNPGSGNRVPPLQRPSSA